MSKTRQVSGGGRAVEVSPDRLEGWYARFAERNGGVSATSLRTDTVVVTAENGTTATAAVPFGPLPLEGAAEGDVDGLAVGPLIAHLRQSRRIGLLLVRLGSHSMGIVRDGQVLVSRTDRQQVHGRSAAGGWSQHRFARRREGQVRQSLRHAALNAFEVLIPRLGEMDAVVLGGDRHALDELREDRRLAPLFARAEARVLEVAEPRLDVLVDAAERAVALEIVVRDS